MNKKKRQQASDKVSLQDKSATLKDLLNQDVLNKLKAQADEWKAEEEKRKEESRKRTEEAKLAEQKRLENDFEHLLNSSRVDWSKYK